MKTTLHFEAPPDLSVGRVRISHQNKTIVDWIATPDARHFVDEEAKPGIYSVEITPAGLPPQAVVFEVREGQANTVSLPSYTALASAGGNTTFYSTETNRSSAHFPTTELFSRMGSLRELNLSTSEASLFEPLRVGTDIRRMSVALSQEAFGRRESYGPFKGHCRLELNGSGFSLKIHRDDQRFEPSERVRLSASIEAVRIERCLVPMYLGGTTVDVLPSPLSASDIMIQVMPSDTRVRSLVRALDAGTIGEARAVQASVSLPAPASFLPASPSADPWAALVYGLLTIKFPEVFPKLTDEWTEELVVHLGWAFDAHIIRASHILTSAPEDRDDQIAAAVPAARHLAQAQVAGAPYYSYTNEVFGEIIGGLFEPEGAENPMLPKETRELIARILLRWNREFPLQRGAGVAFSWLRRDLKVLKETGTLVPNRRSTGVLKSRDTTVVFQGKLGASRITVSNAAGASVDDSLPDHVSYYADGRRVSEVLDYPALHRDPGPPDDPNKGRFGEQAGRQGYRLTAAFGPATRKRGCVAVTMVVVADDDANVELGADVWFFLHPTFSPSRVKVRFKGQRATLTVEAWGGFTVGIWIPSAGVELECDLSKLPYAPKMIQER